MTSTTPPPVTTQPGYNFALSLSDGTNTLGLQLKAGLRRLPRSSGVARKQIRQSTWKGGRGNERLSTDISRFDDDKNAWTLVDGQAINGPQFRFARRMGSQVKTVCVQPRRVYQYTGIDNLYDSHPFWRDVNLDDDPYVYEFTVDETFTAAVLLLPLRFDGAPGLMTVQVAVVGGPIIISTQFGAAIDNPVDPSDTYKSLPCAFTFTTANTYRITLSQSPTEYTATNRWQMLMNHTVVGTTVDLAQFYIHAAPPKRLKGGIFFEYHRSLYWVSQPADGSASWLLRNGEHGVSNGSTSTATLVDVTKNWGTNAWAGWTLYIREGAVNKGEYRRIVKNTSNTLTLDSPLPAIPWNGEQGCEYIITGGDNWYTLDAGLTACVTSVAVLNDIVYFAQGLNTKMRRYREWNNAGIWSSQNQTDYEKVKLLVVTKNITTGDPVMGMIYRADNSYGEAPQVGWGGHDLNVTFLKEIGSKESWVTNLVRYNNTVYAGKEDSIWMLSEQGKWTEIEVGMQRARDERNGIAMAGWNTTLFLSFMDGLERLYGQVLDDIGPNRNLGLPNNRRGYVHSIQPTPPFMYIVVDAGYGLQSSVLATSAPGGDWHEINRGPLYRPNNAGTYEYLSAFYQTVPGDANRLWLTCGGLLASLIMPDDTHNPVNDYNMHYAAESFLITSWIDGDNPELPHHFDELAVYSKNLTAPHIMFIPPWIEVDYQVDQQTLWTPIGTTIDASPYKKVTIGDGNVVGKRIRFRFRLYCDGRTPAILNAFEVRYDEISESLYDVHIPITPDDHITLLDAEDSPDNSKVIMDILDGWRNNAANITMLTAMPTGGQIFNGLIGRIDPVSVYVSAWTESGTKLTGEIVFKTK